MVARVTTALQHLAEAQAQAAEEARHDAEPAPLWEQIAWARHALARYADAPELDQLTQLPAGHCDDCTNTKYVTRRNNIAADTPTAHARYQLGDYQLCRTHAISRLHARRHDLPRTIVPPVQLENLEPPASLTRWAKEAGRHISDRAIVAHLDQWDIHGPDREKLLTIARHIRDGLAAKEAA